MVMVIYTVFPPDTRASFREYNINEVLDRRPASTRSGRDEKHGGSATERRALIEWRRDILCSMLLKGAYSAATLRANHASLDEPLIVLIRNGVGVVPSFQFIPGTMGRNPLVEAVNGDLNAAADPYRAAEWWLSKAKDLADQEALTERGLPPCPLSLLELEPGVTLTLQAGLEIVDPVDMLTRLAWQYLDHGKE